jgi:nucleotide-binding universal stress UspA family protein
VIAGPSADHPGAVQDAQTLEHLRQVTTDRLARGILTLKLMGVRSEMKVRYGDPAAEILDEASSEDYDLIALGAPGRMSAKDDPRRTLIEKVLDQAHRPVLVVPAPRQEI